MFLSQREWFANCHFRSMPWSILNTNAASGIWVAIPLQCIGESVYSVLWPVTPLWSQCEFSPEWEMPAQFWKPASRHCIQMQVRIEWVMYEVQGKGFLFDTSSSPDVLVQINIMTFSYICGIVFPMRLFRRDVPEGRSRKGESAAFSVGAVHFWRRGRGWRGSSEGGPGTLRSMIPSYSSLFDWRPLLHFCFIPYAGKRRKRFKRWFYQDLSHGCGSGQF